MKLDWLTDPTDEAPPTGPDLEAEDDEAFIDAYFDAEGRLPARYFTPGLATDGSEDVIFDPHGVEWTDESAWIVALLRRSRDLRLLSLLARFAILGGRLEQFTETLEQIALMMEVFPIEVHPRLEQAAAERRSALEALNTQATVVMPLLHLPLVPGADATLRRFMVASGRVEPRASEEGLVGGIDVLAPLRSDANLRHTAQAQALLGRAAAALGRIQALAVSNPVASMRLELGAVRAAVGDMQAMIAAARDDLPVWSGDAAPEPADEVDSAPAPGPADAEPVALPDRQPLMFAERPAAVAALAAAEDWLLTHEPSSAAVLLVTQARLLVGVPLVEAIETLLPEDAPRAVLALGRGTGFVLPMDRLKALSAAGQSSRAEAPATDAVGGPEITDRPTLAACLLGIENYFAAHEPTSPIPLLLSRGREMVGRRFDAVIAELIPAQPRQGGGGS